MIARFFRSLLHALKTPWVLALGLVLLLILLVWLLGPLVAVAGYVPLKELLPAWSPRCCLLSAGGSLWLFQPRAAAGRSLPIPTRPGPTNRLKSTRCSCATSCATSGNA